MKFIKNSKAALRRTFRLMRAGSKERIVWNDLLNILRDSDCSFGNFEKEGYVEIKFELEEGETISLRCYIDDGNLRCSVLIVEDFDEEDTLDYLVLASHLNNLLDYRKVVVHTDYNVVEFMYYGDLLKYLGDANEIENDIDLHIYWTAKCLWAFNHMRETGEDPVFVMAEFIKKLEKREEAV